jgi:hypothetical protein
LDGHENLSYRNLTTAQQLVKAYNDHYGPENFTILYQNDKPVIEASLMHDLGTVRGVRIVFTGRVDLSVHYDGKLWNVDHKTTSLYGNSFWDDMGMSAQQRGYCWSLWKATGTLPAGYVINAIRVRRPTKADLALEEATFRADDFQRQFFTLAEADLHEWERNTLALVDEMLYHYENDFMPQKRKWCVGKYGRCQFYDVCSLPQDSRETILTSSLYENDTWTPLNKPKQNEKH